MTVFALDIPKCPQGWGRGVSLGPFLPFPRAGISQAPAEKGQLMNAHRRFQSEDSKRPLKIFTSTLKWALSIRVYK